MEHPGRALPETPSAAPALTTLLFTDIAGSTRLWEEHPAQMTEALARHDALARAAVQDHGGRVVKMVGDGLLAVFNDASDGLRAVLAMQLALADPAATGGIALRLRCGLHAGAVEARDGDVFGPAVNRAARMMAVGHGGQTLISEAAATRVHAGLPPGASLRELGRVRLRDLSQPERVFQLLHPDLPAAFPALRSLESIPCNLPQQLTRFIGREAELEALRTRLTATRLLTLLGPGGIGKTRLAMQLAADRLDDHPDGVWLVELAALTDPTLLLQAVAATLGVREEPGRTLVEALCHHVASRRMLILLDNCEHLLEAAAQYAVRLLQASEHLKLVATSRESLRVRGESIFLVQPLAGPGTPASPHATPPRAASLAGYPAVRLFVERAQGVRAEFALDDVNAPHISAICRQLDGIPLALELAAARLSGMTAAQLAARLSDRFRLLTGGDRSALPRQQTLRALIDWSHDLLDEPERRLLRRLAVFPGAFSAEAAEAVSADPALDLDTMEVLPLLGQLVAKSLVVQDADSGRYHLLESLRQYALGKLSDAGEMPTLRDRHLAQVLAMVGRSRPRMSGPTQLETLRELDAEQAGLVAAHEWACGNGRGGEAALALAWGLYPYLCLRGLSRLGLQQARQALSAAPATASEARARALFAAGQHASLIGEMDAAEGLLRASLLMARELGLDELMAMVLQPLGVLAADRGDLPTALAHLQEALRLARAGGQATEICAGLVTLAQCQRSLGDNRAAEGLLQEALAIANGLGDRARCCIALLNLAMVQIELGLPDRARASAREALGAAREMDFDLVLVCVLEVAAALHVGAGQTARARRLFTAAQALAVETACLRDQPDQQFTDRWKARLDRLDPLDPASPTAEPAPAETAPGPEPLTALWALAAEALD